MPHVQQVHLPSFLSKQAIYNFMVSDFLADGYKRAEIICQSHFYSLWKDEFSYCVIPKVCVLLNHNH